MRRCRHLGECLAAGLCIFCGLTVLQTALWDVSHLPLPRRLTATTSSSLLLELQSLRAASVPLHFVCDHGLAVWLAAARKRCVAQLDVLSSPMHRSETILRGKRNSSDPCSKVRLISPRHTSYMLPRHTILGYTRAQMLKICTDARRTVMRRPVDVMLPDAARQPVQQLHPRHQPQYKKKYDHVNALLVTDLEYLWFASTIATILDVAVPSKLSRLADSRSCFLSPCQAP